VTLTKFVYLLFADDKGQPSMTRFLNFGAFLVSSWVLIKQSAHVEGVGEGLLGVYLAAWAITYVGGAVANAIKKPAAPEVQPLDAEDYNK
jgi:hypothetical protein